MPLIKARYYSVLEPLRGVCTTALLSWMFMGCDPLGFDHPVPIVRLRHMQRHEAGSGKMMSMRIWRRKDQPRLLRSGNLYLATYLFRFPSISGQLLLNVLQMEPLQAYYTLPINIDWKVQISLLQGGLPCACCLKLLVDEAVRSKNSKSFDVKLVSNDSASRDFVF